MSDDTARGGTGDEGVIRALGDEARDLIRRLEGTTVRRLSIQAGAYKVEIERAAGVEGEAALVSRAHVTSEREDGHDTGDGRFPVVAPLVGIFYRSPQPGAKPFVEEGDAVDKDQTVGIVEAMKIMNHVPAGQPGRVAEILVNDGDWVEFEQALMYLEPMDGQGDRDVP